MVAHRSGLIGLPLRLLAREVYGRIVARLGADLVALITGEEKIIPPGARYYVATVEAMPLDMNVEFVAIDEVQLAADLERGRTFTDRILRVRGAFETLFLGALTARPLLERLCPGLNVVTRPRMSVLTYQGEKKLTRLPPRSAVVAFSANEVYAIAELIRRQRGGAAIVMGALSPRTRNAQVELFQSGDVDFLIATDAIGMGLNLDVDHVAFASARKFDGYQFRMLNAGELGQIAGRAGRHMRDGTFGVTGRVAPFADELVNALETHAFPPVKVFQWRNSDLDFHTVPALRASLDEPAREDGLTKAPPADDQVALEHATKTPEVMDMAAGADAVRRLWDVCQVPDYRKIAPANHADLLLTLYGFLMRNGAIADDWIARQVRYADRTDGDIDTLSNRIAHIRTWTFVANRNDWLASPEEWRQTTRDVEDRLSDALHERLMRRFVDRRTSVLMKRLRENAMLESVVNESGDVVVEGQHVGTLHGFRFQADKTVGDPRDHKALQSAASKALSTEMERRADKVAAAADAALVLGSDAGLRWQGAMIAKLTATEDVLKPSLVLLADETLSAPGREKVLARLNQWVAAHIARLLQPLFALRDGTELDAAARGIAYRIAEGLGSVDRGQVAEEAKGLEQTARAGLRQLGVRFGAYHIFVPALLKPAPSQLIALLWALKEADLETPGLSDVPQLSASGRTSIPAEPAISPELYRVVGFRVCGPRAVRIDILERLADQIRPLVSWRPSPEAGDPPPGAIPQGGGFLVTVGMTSLLGCSGEDFAAVLTSLGYRVDRHEASGAEKAALLSAQHMRAKPKKGGAPKAEAQSEATPQEPEAVEPDPTAPPSPDDPSQQAEASSQDNAADAVEGAATVVADTAPLPGEPSAEGAPAPVDAQVSPDIAESLDPSSTAAEEAPADEPAPAKGEAPPAPSDATVADVGASDADGTVPDADGGDAEQAAGTADDDSEAGPVLIEVWRPPRYQRPGARADQRQGRRHGRDGQGAGDKNQKRGQRRPAGADEQAAASQGSQPARDGGRAGGQPENQGRRGKQKRGKPQDKPRQPNPGSRDRADKPADPDSPFAKLAALKQQMEEGRDR
ncbi:MAG: helicase-related protein [Pseudomonadota bacterium]